MSFFSLFGHGLLNAFVPGSFPALPSAMIGINEGFLTQGKPTDWARDLYYSAQWRAIGGPNAYDDGTMARTAIGGYPTHYYQSETTINLILAPLRSAARAGVYTVTYPAGMTCTLSQAAGASVAQAFAGGTGKLNMPQGALLQYPVLTFSGTIPGSGIVVSITKDGEGGTGFYSSDAVSAMAALGKINRSMTPRAVNGDLITRTPYTFTMRSSATRYTGPPTSMGPLFSTPLSVEIQVDACNHAGQHMWWNQSHIDDDTCVTAEANYAATNLAAGKAVFVELSNEQWNTQFKQYNEIIVMGLRAGLGPLGAAPGSLTPETIIYNNNGSNSNNTTVAVNAGDKLFMAINGYGVQVYQAINAQASGVTVTPITTAGANTADGNWTLLYTNTDCIRASRRYNAKRSKEIWAIWDAAFTAAGRSRTVHVVGGQFAYGWSAGIGPKDTFDWDNAYLTIDRLAWGSYWAAGVGASPNNVFSYTINYSTPHSWTAAEKDLLNGGVDIPGFITAWFAIAGDAVATTYAWALQEQGKMNTYCAGKGTSTKVASYETDWGSLWPYGGWPSTHQASLVTAHQNILKDARYATLMTAHLNNFLSLGGEHNVFDRIGPMPSAYPYLTYWALQETDTDTSLRYNAVAAVNAAN